MANKKVKFAIAFTVIAGALMWLTFTGLDDNMQYYIGVKEVKAMSGEQLSKGLRVRGKLVPGSLERSNNTLAVRFVIEEEGEQVTVHYAKELPDTFKDGSEVLVEGKFHEDGYFDAHMLMAKCPSKYESDEYNTGGYGQDGNVSGTY